MLVAKATPTCPSTSIKARLSARLTATDKIPIRTGAEVSPRAKNAGAKTFTSTKAGSPTA
jgi:hypothetical protein